jgi:hypothetical protein
VDTISAAKFHLTQIRNPQWTSRNLQSAICNRQLFGEHTRMLPMYALVLILHSVIRWVVLLTGVVAVIRAITGWRTGRPWTLADDRSGSRFMMALDLQVLLGLILYFALSPITVAALRDFGGAMSDSAIRFWAVEHIFGMLSAMVLAHVGRARIRRVGNDARRHKVAAIFFTLALVAILASIPWPGMANSRPLLRW